MKIIIFSPPFSGHLNVLKYLKNSLEKLGHTIKLVITGWSDIRADLDETGDHSGLSIIQLNGESDEKDANVNSSCPLTFTLERVYNLVEKCLEVCKDFDPKLIIYDFFSLEGYICGKKLSIPTFCSIPAMIGPYRRNNEFFVNKLHNQTNQDLFDKIHDKYGIDLRLENIQQVSDGILIPSDLNIIWSYPKVIACDDYIRYRNLKESNFLVIGSRKLPEHGSSQEVRDLLHKYMKKHAPSPLSISKPNSGPGISIQSPRMLQESTDFIAYESFYPIINKPKIIYISFGTVVTQNLWNHNPEVRPFVKELFEHFAVLFNNKETYKVIMAIGKNEELGAMCWPENFTIRERVNQLKVLKKACMFVTHCGGNSFNEAITSEVPMIGIPFFGDQHLIGHKINKLGLGVAFLHEDNDIYVGTENNPFYRSSLTMESLEHAIDNIELHHENYQDRIRKIVDSTMTVESVIMSYYNYPLTWKSGDLLYGSNQDRLSLIKYLRIENDFRICKYLPFSKLFEDKRGDEHLLPRIVDIYNDGILDPNCYPIESSSRFVDYSANLREFRSWLLSHKEYMAPVDNFLDVTEHNRDEVVWNMCLGGIEFFTQIKGYHIHFVLEKYSKVNKATTLELNYIWKHWDRLRSKISFYKLDSKYGVFARMPLSYINP